MRLCMGMKVKVAREPSARPSTDPDLRPATSRPCATPQDVKEGVKAPEIGAKEPYIVCFCAPPGIIRTGPFVEQRSTSPPPPSWQNFLAFHKTPEYVLSIKARDGLVEFAFSPRIARAPARAPGEIHDGGMGRSIFGYPG
jgi:hypothetical protein